MSAETANKSLIGFHSGVSVTPREVDIAGLRNFAQTSPKEFFGKCQKLIEEKKLTWERIGNLRAFFDAMWGVEIPHYVEIMGSQRAITSAAFPLLSGELAVAGISGAYERVATISQEMVTEIEDNKKFTHIAGLKYQAGGDIGVGVKEGDDFPMVEAGDRRFTIGHFRDGMRLSITQEMIEENEIASIISQINFIGDYLARRIERRSLGKIFDYWGSRATGIAPFVLTLEGAGTKLYTTSTSAFAECPNGTEIQSNALEDSTDLDTVRTHLANRRDTLNERIAMPMGQMQLVVPDALAPTALKILNSKYEPGVINEINNWGPRGKYRPQLLTSPLIDEFTTTAYLMGDMKSQFTRKVKIRMENATLGANTQLFLQKRIAFQARSMYDVDVGAVAYNRVVRVLSATTAPGD